MAKTGSRTRIKKILPLIDTLEDEKRKVAEEMVCQLKGRLEEELNDLEEKRSATEKATRSHFQLVLMTIPTEFQKCTMANLVAKGAAFDFDADGKAILKIPRGVVVPVSCERPLDTGSRRPEADVLAHIDVLNYLKLIRKHSNFHGILDKTGALISGIEKEVLALCAQEAKLSVVLENGY